MRRLLLLLLGSAPVAADDAALQPAIEAAQRRENRLKAIVVEWKVTAFMPKGGRLEEDSVGLSLPRADITVESTHRLALDGERFRADHNDPGVRRQVPVAFDGSLAFDREKSFHRSFHQGRDVPALLVVETPRGHPGYGEYSIRPLALWCRGTHSEPFGGSPTVAAAEIDGAEMVEVRFVRPQSTTKTYWLDRQRDYLVRRIRSESGGTVEVWDIEYQERPGLGWVPSGWTTAKTRAGGRLVQRNTAEVTSLRVDEKTPPETFRLDPLPGESVHDFDVRKSYQVRADGTLEELDESGVVQPSGETAARSTLVWPGRPLVRYVLLPALLAVVVGAVVLRRWRRPPHKPSA